VIVNDAKTPVLVFLLVSAAILKWWENCFPEKKVVSKG
jgi:hypothetical protein